MHEFVGQFICFSRCEFLLCYGRFYRERSDDLQFESVIITGIVILIDKNCCGIMDHVQDIDRQPFAL